MNTTCPLVDFELGDRIDAIHGASASLNACGWEDEGAEGRTTTPSVAVGSIDRAGPDTSPTYVAILW